MAAVVLSQMSKSNAHSMLSGDTLGDCFHQLFDSYTGYSNKTEAEVDTR